MQNKMYSGISLFAGCGGSDIGMAEAGIQTIWANELDESACSLYERVTGLSVMEQGDIRDIDKFPTADILCGCYPCQGYSQGGRRRDSDGINFLYREFDRVLRRLRPLAFIVENVDGMRFSQNKTLLRAQLTRFRSAGYSVSWDVLNAKDYGLAQERRRLFIVGISTKLKLQYKFPVPTCGTNNQPYRTLKDAIWNYKTAPVGSYCDEPFHWYYLSRDRRRSWEEQARCVVAHWRHVGLHPDSPPLVKIDKDRWTFATEGTARRLSYLECAALQGFPQPENFDGVSVRRRFQAIGNAVPPPLFAAVAKQLVATLSTRSYD